MQNQDLAMAREIAAKVAAAGGRVYFVGGCVRDRLLHQDVKDIDIEVHGVSVEKLREILTVWENGQKLAPASECSG